VSLFKGSALTSGGSGSSGVSSSLLLTVSNKSDLPDPIAGVITSPSNTTLVIIENIDLGPDRLVIGPGGSITGIRRNGGGATIISGTTTGALVTVTDSGDYLDIGFNQLGTGDVFNVDGVSGGAGTQILFTRAAFMGKPFRITDGFLNSFITCDFTGGSGIVLGATANATFIGIKETSIFTDQGLGEIAVLIEAGAVLERLLVDTVGFVRLFASKGIVVEEGASLDFLEILNTGFNLFNASAVGIELANPDAIGLGLINNVTFEPGASSFASAPVSDATFAVSLDDVMILNGNLWTVGGFTTFIRYDEISSTEDTTFTFGTSLTAITTDGVNVIVGIMTR